MNLEDNKKAFMELLRIPSVTGSGADGEEKACAFLEHILQDKGGQAEHQDPAIAQGVVQHLAFGTQHQGHRPEQQHPQHGQHDASDQRR